ncbi:hypothetical protein CPLU01_15119 [Colletotrichum plurivorum]|uniref:Uncharacterized protein n=1 Tax=Colletotrichum plurivorum TaxID=2175906 RepID=A0A8H6JE58_9PEZI|nr:hypothetical protein CPLU01_15119 [Colletotrichum plurivorum]
MPRRAKGAAKGEGCHEGRKIAAEGERSRHQAERHWYVAALSHEAPKLSSRFDCPLVGSILAGAEVGFAVVKTTQRRALGWVALALAIESGVGDVSIARPDKRHSQCQSHIGQFELREVSSVEGFDNGAAVLETTGIRGECGYRHVLVSPAGYVLTFGTAGERHYRNEPSAGLAGAKLQPPTWKQAAARPKGAPHPRADRPSSLRLCGAHHLPLGGGLIERYVTVVLSSAPDRAPRPAPAVAAQERKKPAAVPLHPIRHTRIDEPEPWRRRLWVTQAGKVIFSHRAASWSSNLPTSIQPILTILPFILKAPTARHLIYACQLMLIIAATVASSTATLDYDTGTQAFVAAQHNDHAGQLALATRKCWFLYPETFIRGDEPGISPADADTIDTAYSIKDITKKIGRHAAASAPAQCRIRRLSPEQEGPNNSELLRRYAEMCAAKSNPARFIKLVFGNNDPVSPPCRYELKAGCEIDPALPYRQNVSSSQPTPRLNTTRCLSSRLSRCPLQQLISAVVSTLDLCTTAMSQLSKLAHLTSLAWLLRREDLDLCELRAVASLQQLQHVEAR